MAYLLDANCFIESYQRWYGLDFCPGFWSWLDQQNAVGQLFSFDKIKDELCKVDNDLKTWVQQRGESFFLPVDGDAMNRYSNISTWLVNSSGLAPQNISLFLSGADPWLIAYASAHGYTIITREKQVDPTSKKVKIPNVCQQFGVACADLVAVIRQSGAKLELV